MLSKIDKLKYELKNKQMFDKCENNVHLLIEYNGGIKSFDLFNYIISCCDILEYPVSLLSLFSMYDVNGNPLEDNNLIFKNYKRILFGNKNISYLRNYIDSFSLDQLKNFYHIYSKFWQYSFIVYKILELDCDSDLVYHYIFEHKLHKNIKFKINLNTDEIIVEVDVDKTRPYIKSFNIDFSELLISSSEIV